MKPGSLGTSGRVLLAVALISLGLQLSGQESAEDQNSEPGKFEVGEDLLIQDIRTASFLDLAVWLQSLGLEPIGNRDALQRQLYSHFGLTPPVSSPSNPEIEIREADSLSAQRQERDGPRILRLGGNVSVIFHDRDTDSIHTISAEQILLDEETDILSASGKVRYLLNSGDREEIFEGTQLYFDVDDWSGIFLQGASTQISEDDAPEFRYTGTTITRSADDLIRLREGVITSSVWDPPAYTIEADEILVYAPGEWSLSRGVLKVGHIPVFGIPGFFNPVEKIFFHPSTGTDSRRGEFIQTTTYLVGRAEEPDALFDFMRFENDERKYEQQIEGLFLRNTETELSEEKTTPSLLRFFGDFYTRLGFHFGVEGSFADLGPVRSLKFYAGLARTRNLYTLNGASAPFYFDPDTGEYRSSWNEVLIGTERFPLRFALDLSSSLTLGGLNLSLKLPYATDSQYYQDVSDRKEFMPWAQIIGFGSEEESEAATDSRIGGSQGSVTSQNWQLSGNGRIALPGLSPFVSSISISRLSSELIWKNVKIAPSSLDLEDRTAQTSPDTNTFLVERVIPLRLDLRFQGTLFDLDELRKSSGSSTAPEEAPPESQEQQLYPDPTLPWDTPDSQDSEIEDPAPSGELTRPLLPGLLDPGSASSAGANSGKLTLSYDVSNNIDLNLNNRIPGELVPETFQSTADYWNRGESLRLNLRLNGSLPTRILDFTSSSSLYWNDRLLYDWSQEQEDDPASLRRLVENVAVQNQLQISQVNTLTLSPFLQVELLSGSELRYTLSPRWFLRKFDYVDDDFVPQYEEETFSWDDASITQHSLSASLVFGRGDLGVRVSSNAVLPPKPESYTSSLSVSIDGIGSLTASTGISFPNEQATWSALNVGLIVSPAEIFRLSSNFRYNLEEKRAERLTNELRFGPLTANLLFDYRKRMEFDTDDGWTEVGEREFIPYSLGIAVGDEVEIRRLWKNRIELDLDFGLGFQQGIQRVTDSVLTVDVGLDFRIFEFLDLSFSAKSSNTKMYVYFPFLLDRLGSGYEPVNMFTDLLKSFNFFSIEDRTASNFNLSSLSMEATHFLGDWNLELAYTLKPQLNTARDAYKWDSLFSFTVAWLPIPEISRSASVDEDSIITVEE